MLQVRDERVLMPTESIPAGHGTTGGKRAWAICDRSWSVPDQVTANGSRPIVSIEMGRTLYACTACQLRVRTDSSAASSTACTRTPSSKSGANGAPLASACTKSATWCTNVCS